MARILVVSDKGEDARLVKAAVVAGNHYVGYTASGLDACVMAAETQPDIVLVGEQTEDVSGLNVVKQLRRQGTSSILMMGLENDTVSTRVRAYEAGADETVPRPLDLEELGWRVQARVKEPTQRLVIDDSAKKVYLEGVEVHVTPAEYIVLSILMEEPGRTYGTQELMARYYGTEDYVADEAVVRMHIMNLRKRLGQDLIETNSRHGYRVRI